MPEIKPGVDVLARDVTGRMLPRRAMSEVETKGHDFPVVWVCRQEEYDAAQHEGREPDMVPWPAEDVEVAAARR